MADRKLHQAAQLNGCPKFTATEAYIVSYSISFRKPLGTGLRFFPRSLRPHVLSLHPSESKEIMVAPDREYILIVIQEKKKGEKNLEIQYIQSNFTLLT